MLIDFSKPWCIAEYAVDPYLRQYQHVLSMQAAGLDIRTYSPVDGIEKVTPKAISFTRGSQPFEGAAWTIKDGVANIDVRGPITRYGGMMSSLSGMSSTAQIMAQLGEAFAFEGTKAIVLNIDSPGGEATSIPEAAQMIYDMRNQGKPIVAYADGACCSAAYWLASACDMIVAAQGSTVGSIGAIVGLVDDTESMKMEGLKEFRYVSSVSPRKAPKPGTKIGDEDYQARADTLGEIFVEAVAKYRGVSADTVIKDFGQGGVFDGKGAVKAGLADMVGDYDSIVSDLSNSKMPSPRLSIGEKVMAMFKNKEEDTPLVAGQSTEISAMTPEVAAQLAAYAKQNSELAAQLATIKAAGRDKAVTDFMASVKPKVAPAATDALKAIAVSAYDGTPVSLEALSAFFENMQSHGAMAEVPLDEAKNITAVDNPENAAALNAVDDAAVEAANKKARIKETK